MITYIGRTCLLLCGCSGNQLGRSWPCKLSTSTIDIEDMGHISHYGQMFFDKVALFARGHVSHNMLSWHQIPHVNFVMLSGLRIKLGTRLHFDFIVIIKVNTVNDNVVTTRRTISKQRPWAIYSAPVA